MRQRRDPFARITYVPRRAGQRACTWCGMPRRVSAVQIESDGGSVNELRGYFCSWTCAEAYHDAPIGR